MAWNMLLFRVGGEGLRLMRLTRGVIVDEDSENLYIYVMLPGFRKEDIEVYTNGRIVRIEAKVPEVLKKFVRSEKIVRRIPITSTVDVDKAKSRFENGLLMVTLPKKAKGKKIAVE
ncbi:MAG: hypothetical protein DRJ32_05095 [Thermoprotei archaeon]|nr:MAG: hypothetical protein DRJ32_05095 [Thermoprotei archaeon]